MQQLMFITTTEGLLEMLKKSSNANRLQISPFKLRAKTKANSSNTALECLTPKKLI